MFKLFESDNVRKRYRRKRKFLTLPGGIHGYLGYIAIWATQPVGTQGQLGWDVHWDTQPFGI